MESTLARNDRVSCPACGVEGDPAKDAPFHLRGRHAGHPVYQCARCDAAFTAGGADRGSALPPKVWKAMKAAWKTWDRQAAIGWLSPPGAAGLLIGRRADKLERLLYEAYEPDDPPTGYFGVSFRDFIEGAVTLTWGLLHLYPDCAGLEPVMARFRHRFPLGAEAAAAADELLRLAFWSMLARYLSDVSMDRLSDAYRVLKVDELRGTAVGEVGSPAGPLPAEFLVWLLGAEAAQERTLAEAWTRVVDASDSAAYASIENMY
jgi:hypothetical protein